MRIIEDDLWLCGDCMAYEVNGDLPPDTDTARDEAITEGVARLGPHLVPDFGEQPRTFECDECDKEFPAGQVEIHGHLLTQCPSCLSGELRETTRDSGEEEFSRRKCDACGTPLAGARYRFAILGEDK